MQVNTVVSELEEIDRLFREVQMAHTVAEHQNSLLYTPSPSAAESAAIGAGKPFTPGGVMSGGGRSSVTPPNPALMLHLIQQYPDLQSKIDQLASRLPVVDTDFNATDFPTEVWDRLAVISRCDKYAKAIALKDEMLWIAMV